MYCELVDKELKDSFVEYTLLYDTIANRVSIEEVSVKDGAMQLMKNLAWAFDSLPHMLIAGGTGGGKRISFLRLLSPFFKPTPSCLSLIPKMPI